MVQLDFDFATPPTSKPNLETAAPLTQWQRYLALPVIALANAWIAMTGNGLHPCRTCRTRRFCSRGRCVAFAAYEVGLSWRFGEIDLMEATPIAIARSGDHFEGVHS